jgi:hypothetical protein
MTTEYRIPPPQTVADVARQARAAFSLETRVDGSEYWNRNRCAPDWIGELCHTAHGPMLADDYRYQFIVEALDALEEADDPDEAGEYFEFEPYYSRLVDWLSGHVGYRLDYCDQWAEEYGQPDDHSRSTFSTGQLLQGGYLFERLEVLALVRGSLEAQLEALAAA